MTELGEIYRDFRKGKSITLADAAQGIVSVPFLSKFERGYSDISYTHLIELLERINVQIVEFDYVYQQRNNQAKDFVPNFQSAYQSGNIKTLQSLLTLWQKKEGEFAKLQVIQIKMMLTTLNKDTITSDELHFLQNYFEKIETWTFFELYLYGHAMPFLDMHQMIGLFKMLHTKGIIYDNFRHDSFSIIFYLFNNVILNLISRGAPESALEFVTLLETYQTDERDYYHKTRFFSLKGLALYMTNQKAAGLLLLKKSITITNLVEHNRAFVENERQYLQTYLTEQELIDVFDENKKTRS